MKQIFDYIFNKKWIGIEAIDLIPVMLTNIYNVNIVIIDDFKNLNRVVTPTSGPYSNTYIHVLKRGQHYDALRPKPRRIDTKRQ